jgi:hypothetical protein
MTIFQAFFIYISTSTRLASRRASVKSAGGYTIAEGAWVEGAVLKPNRGTRGRKAERLPGGSWPMRVCSDGRVV